MRVNAIFAEVRLRYFPRWDRERRWTAQLGDANQCRNNTGYCDSDVKTIDLDERSVRGMSAAGVRAFLIHEICHNLGAACHNRAWATRMERAAERAEELNECEVAGILRSDIYSYAGAGVLQDYDLCSVLDYARDLIGRNPSMDYEAALRRVARYFGHSRAKVRRDFGGVIEDVMSGIT